MASSARFCGVCAAQTEKKIPAGDNREREVCPQCGEIFYCNPKIVAGAILDSDDSILLCKRAIEPRKGLWTVPAGFMENHESVVEAAARESKEEACANAETLYLHGIYNLKYIDQVYMLYRGALLDGQYAPGHETLETKLFKFDEIPWDDLAFVVIKHALELYLEDCKRMDFRIHEANLFKDGNGEIKFARYN